jgi:D-glycero-alpha-D-manno-heptose-7-phosphate kinase
MLITQTPLRISLLGGGTDLKEFYEFDEGYVISTAIDKFIFVIVKERYDDLIYVNYSKKEIVKDIFELEHELVKECLFTVGIKNGLEISILADIPSEGSGLGSSSSLTVGLLNALYIFLGKQVPPERLAEEACDIEINRCKKPIGKQDQYIAAFGGLNSFLFNKDGSVTTKGINISESEKRILGSNMLLFYTGVTRKSNEILSEQSKETKKNFAFLKEIKELAVKAENVIYQKKFGEIGLLLKRNWELKKKLARKISNDEIDKMYQKAMKGGASGAKISGAGGGGFMLVYCERNHQNSVREAMKEYREMPFLLENDGSKVIFNYRRYSWK